MKIEDLATTACVQGILPDVTAVVVNTEWHGSDALTLVYRDPAGRVANELIYRRPSIHY